LALAQQDRVELPSRDAEELSKLVRVSSSCASLVEYLEAYRITLSVMQTRHALVRCSLEGATNKREKNKRTWFVFLNRCPFSAFELGHEDGCSYVEARFCPTLHTKGGLTPTEVLEAVLEGRKQAEETMPGFRAGIIVCAMRHHDVAESVEVRRTRNGERQHSNHF
jgi:adenosine deaminase